MKDKRILYTLLFLIFITLVSTYIFLEIPSPMTTSENFLRTSYTVTEEDRLILFDILDTMAHNNGPDVLSEYTEHASTIYGIYMTEKGYNQFIGNRYELALKQYDLESHYESQVTEIQLIPSLEEETHAVYNFTVTLLLTFDDGHSEVVTDQGYVNLNLVDDAWLVDKFRMDLKFYYDQVGKERP